MLPSAIPGCDGARNAAISRCRAPSYQLSSILARCRDLDGVLGPAGPHPGLDNALRVVDGAEGASFQVFPEDKIVELEVRQQRGQLSHLRFCTAADAAFVTFIALFWFQMFHVSPNLFECSLAVPVPVLLAVNTAILFLRLRDSSRSTLVK